ncbi:group IIE secretory phospholipase A2-like isoform X1 [Coturnix japonica]|uniref:group IIE secretory phospholipase A2-like isoform X1 n=1 Tax=Coturnix japonica TaxID=93934 RepID=UPI0013A5CE09|nr:group IIE secretory phospholipase A2-like isoform X1 [Coturnix japonica]
MAPLFSPFLEGSLSNATNSMSPVAGLAPVSCNLLQFASMIKEKTGKSALSYNTYGCHCGPGGSKMPVDPTDWCCHAHDCCYKRLTSLTCVPHLVPYDFSIKGGQITCESVSSCKRGTCECDKKAAECFKRNLRTFSKSYQNYSNFKCKGSLPRC